MGLPVRIVLHAPDRPSAETAARAAFARIAALDRMMSDYRADSELRRLEHRSGEHVTVSPELFAVVTRAREVARATGGAFDPTVAPLVALWREARTTGRLPDRKRVASARTTVGWELVDVDPVQSSIRLTRPGVRLDLGGIAKGYILQEALRILRDAGVTCALVESGGDMIVGDAPPGRAGWRIETPGADSAFAERASRLTNAALATSGSTAQFVEIDGTRYSHIIDPRTGFGVTNGIMARVIAADAATADALATALTIVDDEQVAAILTQFPGVMASRGR